MTQNLITILKQYKEEKGLSQDELSKQMEIPLRTLVSWLKHEHPGKLGVLVIKNFLEKKGYDK